MTRLKCFSEKQLLALSWWRKGSPWESRAALLCDGAVRSGKTLCTSLSFFLWADECFRDTAFALCGKTVPALRRNVVEPLLPLLRGLGFTCEDKLSSGCITAGRSGKRNRFYLFGGRDESSAALIQGVTLGGVLLDEAALMPRSFVEQALARCSLPGSRFWFNCNPEHPQHWLYREWFSRPEEKNALRLHFTMDDNPALSPEIRKRYETLYSGRFYDRFVRGLWVRAEGLVYPGFSEELLFDTPPEAWEQGYLSCDYGTVNPTSVGLWGLAGGVWHRMAEYYHDSRAGMGEAARRTDEEHYRALCGLAGTPGAPGITAVVVDPSAASFMECIRRHGRFRVIPAKNDIVNGIRLVSGALAEGKLRFSRSCRDSIREFGLYSFEENSEHPRKENDHAMDDIRYFVSTVLSPRQGDGFFSLSLPRGTAKEKI